MLPSGTAGDAQHTLEKLLPKEALFALQDNSIEQSPVTELNVGDTVRVQAGENIPADGEIIRGTSRVNEALLTGESKPIEKSEGDTAIGGSTNGQGTLFIKISQTGDSSFLSQVQNLVTEAQGNPSRAENRAHQVASWLFYIALGVALVTFVAWWRSEEHTSELQSRFD